MPKKHSAPWYRKDRDLWYVTLDGKQINLGADEEKAQDRFHKLMLDRSKRQKQKKWVVPADAVAAICKRYLDWAKKNRSEATWECAQ
jgi:hypothetical protein